MRVVRGGLGSGTASCLTSSGPRVECGPRRVWVAMTVVARVAKERRMAEPMRMRGGASRAALVEVVSGVPMSQAGRRRVARSC